MISLKPCCRANLNRISPVYIEALSTIKSSEGTHPPGTFFFCPDDQAFLLIQAGSAKPANRSSRKLFDQMKASLPAPPPEDVDIRDQFVSAPKTDTPRALLFGASNGLIRAR